MSQLHPKERYDPELSLGRRRAARRWTVNSTLLLLATACGRLQPASYDWRHELRSETKLSMLRERVAVASGPHAMRGLFLDAGDEFALVLDGDCHTKIESGSIVVEVVLDRVNTDADQIKLAAHVDQPPPLNSIRRLSIAVQGQLSTGWSGRHGNRPGALHVERVLTVNACVATP
jgi:hypothetical protein